MLVYAHSTQPRYAQAATATCVAFSSFCALFAPESTPPCVLTASCVAATASWFAVGSSASGSGAHERKSFE
jgi:hypothetical protein